MGMGKQLLTVTILLLFYCRRFGSCQPGFTIEFNEIKFTFDEANTTKFLKCLCESDFTCETSFYSYENESESLDTTLQTAGTNNLTLQQAYMCSICCVEQFQLSCYRPGPLIPLSSNSLLFYTCCNTTCIPIHWISAAFNLRVNVSDVRLKTGISLDDGLTVSLTINTTTEIATNNATGIATRTAPYTSVTETSIDVTTTNTSTDITTNTSTDITTNTSTDVTTNTSTVNIRNTSTGITITRSTTTTSPNDVSTTLLVAIIVPIVVGVVVIVLVFLCCVILHKRKQRSLRHKARFQEYFNKQQLKQETTSNYDVIDFNSTTRLENSLKDNVNVTSKPMSELENYNNILYCSQHTDTTKDNTKIGELAVTCGVPSEDNDDKADDDIGHSENRQSDGGDDKDSNDKVSEIKDKEDIKCTNSDSLHSKCFSQNEQFDFAVTRL